MSEYLHTEDITRMNWRDYSPDFTLIEYEWGALKSIIFNSSNSTPDLPGVENALLKEWCGNPHE